MHLAKIIIKYFLIGCLESLNIKKIFLFSVLSNSLSIGSMNSQCLFKTFQIQSKPPEKGVRVCVCERVFEREREK